MKVQPYLFLEGRCEEALEFYARALGAKVSGVMRYKDSPEPQAPCAGLPAGFEQKVMHAAMTIGETTVMASDGRVSGQPDFKGIGLTLEVEDEATAKRRFDALAEGGQVQMPLGKTFFAPAFGMVSDRFGVLWMVLVPMPG